MRNLTSWGLVILILTLAFVGCSTNLAGGSSDHGNARVVGVISDSTGAGVENVFVRLLRENYNPVSNDFPIDSLVTVTNAQGYFEFEKVVKGVYCLTGVGPKGQLFCIKKPIHIDTTMVNTAHATLLRPGSIKAPLHNKIWQYNSKLSVYIPGTNIYKTVEHNVREVFLDNVPEGTHSLWVHKHSQDSTVILDLDYSGFAVFSDIIMDFTIVPVKPNGPRVLQVNEEHNFYTLFEYWNTMPDINVEFLEYRFSWGDSDTTRWINNLGHSHRWKKAGSYDIRVQLRYLPDPESITLTQPGPILPFYSGWSRKSRIDIKSY